MRNEAGARELLAAAVCLARKQSVSSLQASPLAFVSKGKRGQMLPVVAAT